MKKRAIRNVFGFNRGERILTKSDQVYNDLGSITNTKLIPTAFVILKWGNMQMLSMAMLEM